MEENWDYLIVLDGCRYDYFSMLCESYLHGELKKVVSVGSDTLEWCKGSFREKYDDVVYVSANPHINSQFEVRGFNAREHFSKVVDVWKWGWNEALGTVHPEEVNQAVLRFKHNNLDRRFIIHYLQPHEPYIGTFGFLPPLIGLNQFISKIRKSGNTTILRKPVKMLGSLAKRTETFARNPQWKIRELLNLPPACPMDAVRRAMGDNGLRRAYIENLRLVLVYVAELVADLSGEIVVTADHGELLGEGGAYSHPAESSNPSLIEIPWFKVDKANR